MANSKKVELILGVKTTGAVEAAAGLDSISKVAGQLSGELSKLERADTLKQLGATAAQVGVDIGSVDQAAERLAAELKAIGATEAEIRKVSAAFDKTIGSIEKARMAQEKLGAAMAKDVVSGSEKARASQEKLGAAMAKDAEKSAAAAKTVTKEVITLDGALKQIGRQDAINTLATKYGTVAKKTKDATTAAAALNEELKKINATEGEIQGAAGTFAQSADTSNGPGGNLLQRLGAQGRNLPSIQIPGAGIGTDAISNLTRLTGALGEAAGASKAMSAATAILTPLIGATAASIGGVIAVAGPVVLVIGAIGAALTVFSNNVAEQAKVINEIVEGQREIGQKIAEGLTSSQAAEELETLNKKRKDEEDRLFKLQQVYDETINANKSVAHIIKLTSGAEEELITQMSKGKDLIRDYDGDIQALTTATEDGAFAANDAAEAEKKLAAERTKTALASADSAAKSLQAEQKALASTEEQNNARLTAIDNEKAVAQEQIDVLTASGVTSEEVTAKIKSLNDQLGLLGQESSFIKDTALAVSKQNDADKKAKKDAEDAAKKAQAAQEQYTKAVQAAGTSYSQSLQDISTRLTQALSDNTTKFNRDLSALAMKYQRDEFDLTIKAQRAERDALMDQQEDLKDIRKDAAKEEQDAIRDGDFKALYLSRVKAEETITAEQEGLDLSRQKREQSNRDAQADLLRNAQRQRSDRMLGFEQQSADIRTNNQRESAQARLSHERALAAAKSAQDAGVAQVKTYWGKLLGVQQDAINQSLKMAAGQTGGAGGAQRPGGFTGSFVANAVGRLVSK